VDRLRACGKVGAPEVNADAAVDIVYIESRYIGAEIAAIQIIVTGTAFQCIIPRIAGQVVIAVAAVRLKRSTLSKLTERPSLSA